MLGKSVAKHASDAASAGVLGVVRTLALATLVFGGLGLSEAKAFGPALLGAALLGLVMAAWSGLVGSPQSNAAAIVAVAVAAVVTNSDAGPDEKFALALATVVVASVLTGATLFLGGKFKLGRLVRFLPYPVVGGFLAATGYLLLKGAWDIAIGAGSDWIVATTLLVGIALAASGRSPSVWAQPLVVAAAATLFFAVLAITGTALADAEDWLLGPFADQSLSMSDLLLWTTADFTQLVPGVPMLLTIPAVAALSLLLNASGIEISQRTELSLDEELKAAGIGNVMGGIVGGLPGWQSITLQQLIGTERWARWGAVLIALISGGLAFVGAGAIGYVPVFLVAGVIIGLGLDLIFEWLVQARRGMTRTDYFVTISVVAATVVFGFVTGVIVGILAAVVLFLVEYSNVAVVHSAVYGNTYRSNVDRPDADDRLLDEAGHQIELVRLHGFVFFGSADRLVNHLKRNVSKLRFLILDGTRVTGLDGSARFTLERFFLSTAEQGVTVILTNFPEEFSGTKSFTTADEGLEWAEDEIIGRGKELLRSVDEQLADLAGPWAADLRNLMVKTEYEPGDILVAEGSVGHPLSIIEYGSIRVVIGDRRIRSIRPGAIIGEMSYYTRSPASAAVVAETQVIAYELSVDKLDDILATHPELAAELHRRMARIMARRVATTNGALHKAWE